jgi:hypothetical protein
MMEIERIVRYKSNVDLSTSTVAVKSGQGFMSLNAKTSESTLGGLLIQTQSDPSFYLRANRIQINWMITQPTMA